MTTNVTTTLPEASDGPLFRFRVPQGFHEVPLGVTPEAHAELLQEFAREYWGQGAELEPLRAMTGALYGAARQALAAQGVRYQAVGVFPRREFVEGRTGIPGEEGEPLPYVRNTLLATVRDLNSPDQDLAAAGIAELLFRQYPDDEVVRVSLPAGPAVLHLAASRLLWGGPDTPDQLAGTVRTTVRLELWIPFPSGDRILLLALTTPDTGDLDTHQALLAEVASTVEFPVEGDFLPDEPADSGAQINPFG
ncbi:hypothetical protein [Streptomyces benahoarensis]|uniref:Uncharacterized protein n=1 Tax=Streptomyces benahoarensis TaxID=2595054 RepID=A0A553ZL49_9ACTN|nr:hypothetical protein [Streptomyces benahoarensis]TSB22437.1 hypothetical protein FNJ62_16320 [Streptomyces benahoarensis]TSB42208.1 hypothetical protein FNZ23_11070 [Streptomyces benahoarensis]